MAPTARELLAEAAATGEDLETVARAVLERLAQLTDRDDRFIATSPTDMPGVTVLSACSGHGFKFASVMGELWPT
jgi:glycine/D-amino acid oxidase-like deaminating enzyme